MSVPEVRGTTDVLGVPIAAVNSSMALTWVAEDLEKRRKGHICFVSVHGLMVSLHDPAMARSYAAARLRLPDGAPLAWVGRWNGVAHMERVAGPEFMLEVFADERFRNATHFLYGGAPEVAQQLAQCLVERFPHARIVGTFTPPFGDLNQDDEETLFGELRRLKPDILWVGVGCPRQELFMHRYADKLTTTLMFGVGAAFDYHTGRIQDSPGWIKRCGLQWLHRLMQDPRRLWKRYLWSNSAFLYRILLQILHLSAKPADAPGLSYRR